MLILQITHVSSCFVGFLIRSQFSLVKSLIFPSLGTSPPCAPVSVPPDSDRRRGWTDPWCLFSKVSRSLTRVPSSCCGSESAVVSKRTSDPSDSKFYAELSDIGSSISFLINYNNSMPRFQKILCRDFIDSKFYSEIWEKASSICRNFINIKFYADILFIASYMPNCFEISMLRC